MPIDREKGEMDLVQNLRAIACSRDKLIGTCFPEEIIKAAIVPKCQELPKINGVYYYAFAIFSASSHRDAILAVAHKDKKSNKIILDRIEEKRPHHASPECPFIPGDFFKSFAKIIKNYGISYVTGDKYVCCWPPQAVEANGLNFKRSELRKGKIYRSFRLLLIQEKVKLLDNKKLFYELRSVEKQKEMCHSVYQVANAAAGACVMAFLNEFKIFPILKEKKAR